LTATNTHLFCYNNQAFQSIQRSDSDETASFLGVGRCDLHDYGHGHRLQTEIRKGRITMSVYTKLACFAGGALFGSFGIKLLSSKDAKKAYVHVTAAGLRMKDSVMGTVTTVQENAADILASAKELNEDRAAKEAEEAAAANLESEEA
jgi:hypothetical protein